MRIVAGTATNMGLKWKALNKKGKVERNGKVGKKYAEAAKKLTRQNLVIQ